MSTMHQPWDSRAHGWPPNPRSACLDHDDFASNRSKIINVIDSYSLAMKSSKNSGALFRHHTLDGVVPLRADGACSRAFSGDMDDGSPSNNALPFAGEAHSAGRVRAGLIAADKLDSAFARCACEQAMRLAGAADAVSMAGAMNDLYRQ
ncbi:MAG: hypothetical protein HY056_07375 [Proteobacteria bacterium]|nr:hypothetical protein [Pseudomonadota bacterium]